jgi:hypothetical protein
MAIQINLFLKYLDLARIQLDFDEQGEFQEFKYIIMPFIIDGSYLHDVASKAAPIGTWRVHSKGFLKVLGVFYDLFTKIHVRIWGHAHTDQ